MNFFYALGVMASAMLASNTKSPLWRLVWMMLGALDLITTIKHTIK